jgi:hypothetical protein
MKQEDNNRILISTKIIYAAATLIFLIGIALLADNIILFKNNVAHYVAQGYPSAEVVKQLLPGQLLPGIFEPVAIYWGIAAILFCGALINQKISFLTASIMKVNTGVEIDKKELAEEVASE